MRDQGPSDFNKFKAQIQERRGNKKGQGKTDAAGEAQPKRRRGQSRKQA